MLSTDTDTISENLVGWKVSEVTSKLITIDLEFSLPLHVS